jgi:hypothetical protein
VHMRSTLQWRSMAFGGKLNPLQLLLTAVPGGRKRRRRVSLESPDSILEIREDFRTDLGGGNSRNLDEL